MMTTMLSIDAGILADACDNKLFTLQTEKEEKTKKIVEDYMYEVSLETGIFWKVPGRVISYEQAVEEISNLEMYGSTGEVTAKNKLLKLDKEYNDDINRLENLYQAACFVCDQYKQIDGGYSDLMVCLEDFSLIKEELNDLLTLTEEKEETPQGTN